MDALLSLYHWVELFEAEINDASHMFKGEILQVSSYKGKVQLLVGALCVKLVSLPEYRNHHPRINWIRSPLVRRNAILHKCQIDERSLERDSIGGSCINPLEFRAICKPRYGR